jgi:uncharacterized protein YbjT (DUF2867 family)
MAKIAVVAGSTGLIGKALIRQLCADPAYGKVIALVRRPGSFNQPGVDELVVAYDKLEDYADRIKGDVIFSCLGTTKKQTPDRKAYFKIDHDYPLQVAQIASRNNVAQFHFISSIGANTKATAFYLSTKGKAEQDIAEVSFVSLHIYRPSFLNGPREDKRLVEKAGIALFAVLKPLMIGPFRKYRSITDHDVAAAMIRQSNQGQPGIHYYESDDMQRIAEGH